MLTQGKLLVTETSNNAPSRVSADLVLPSGILIERAR